MLDRDFKLVFQMLCIRYTECVCAHEGHMGEVMRLCGGKNELQIQECNERSGF